MRPHAAHIGCETPAAVAAVAIIGEKARPLFDFESAAASGTDADAVHDMRVASRRTREALAGFSELYARHEREEALSLIRSVTRALGPVRDADVLLAEFARLCERIDDAEARSALAWLVGYHQREREVRLKRMRRRLGRLDLTARRGGFMRALETTRRGDLATGPLEALARSVIAERLDAALAHVPAALNAYEAARLGPANEVVLANRSSGPDTLLREVHVRTGDRPFARIEDVMGEAEMRAIVENYQRIAGFERETLERRGSLA